MPAIQKVRRKEPLRALHYLGPADRGRLEELLGDTVLGPDETMLRRNPVKDGLMIVGNDDNYWVKPGDWVVKLPEDYDLLVFSQRDFHATFEVQS